MSDQKDFFEEFQRIQNNIQAPFGSLEFDSSKIKGNLDHVDLLDGQDEILHDHIEYQIRQKPRLISELKNGEFFLNEPIPSVESLMENFKCTICMNPVKTPTVIKHCLHFFCKECVNASITYKKECPLCKETMKTHRELRPYAKM